MNATFIRNRVTAMALIVGIVLMLIASTFPLNPIHAETGKGDDVFRVIMTIFGVDKSKGDVIAIVTANNGEASKVKFLDSEAPYVIPLNSSGGTSGHLIEYVATFPNMTVNAGEEYKVCALSIKDSSLICETGNNSPALRPEFIDLHLKEQTPTTSQAAMVSDEER